MDKDFLKGVAVYALGFVTIITLFYYMARSFVYVDQFRAKEIVTCQQNGYSWGECWNVILGDKRAFDK